MPRLSAPLRRGRSSETFADERKKSPLPEDELGAKQDSGESRGSIPSYRKLQGSSAKETPQDVPKKIKKGTLSHAREDTTISTTVSYLEMKRTTPTKRGSLKKLKDLSPYVMIASNFTVNS